MTDTWASSAIILNFSCPFDILTDLEISSRILRHLTRQEFESSGSRNTLWILDTFIGHRITQIWTLLNMGFLTTWDSSTTSVSCGFQDCSAEFMVWIYLKIYTDIKQVHATSSSSISGYSWEPYTILLRCVKFFWSLSV